MSPDVFGDVRGRSVAYVTSCNALATRYRATVPFRLSGVMRSTTDTTLRQILVAVIPACQAAESNGGHIAHGATAVRALAADMRQQSDQHEATCHCRQACVCASASSLRPLRRPAAIFSSALSESGPTDHGLCASLRRSRS